MFPPQDYALTLPPQSTTGASLALGEIIVSPFFKLVGRPNWQLATASVFLAVFSALMSLVDESKQGLGIAVSIYKALTDNLLMAISLLSSAASALAGSKLWRSSLLVWLFHRRTLVLRKVSLLLCEL